MDFKDFLPWIMAGSIGSDRVKTQHFYCKVVNSCSFASLDCNSKFAVAAKWMIFLISELCVAPSS